jgi:hypothetical protein
MLKITYIAIALLAGSAIGNLQAGAQEIGKRSIEVTPTKPQVNLLGEVRTTKIPKQIFYEKVSPLAAREALLTAGFISVEDRPIGSILDAHIAGKEQSIDDIVFIDRGAIEGVAVGDRFFVYRRIREVPYPDTGKEFGHLVSILGEVEVIKINEPVDDKPGFFTRTYRKIFKKKNLKIHSATCRIVKSYNPILVGDLIIPKFDVYVPTMDEDRPLKDKRIGGIVAAIGLENQIGAKNDFIYLTVGRKDGVDEGDVFAIYKTRVAGSDSRFGYKDLAGKAKVITVREKSTTAVVTLSIKEILIGDTVSYIQQR